MSAAFTMALASIGLRVIPTGLIPISRQVGMRTAIHR